MAILRCYTIDQPDVQKVIEDIKNWQGQADSVSRLSSDAEIIDAYVDWGVAQGCLNSLRQIKVISSDDYDSLSKKQMIIREKLSGLLKARRES